MLINLLTQLTDEMKREKLYPAPQQIFDAAKYILLSDELFPEPDLEDSLKPIFVSALADEIPYKKAWQRLREKSNNEKRAGTKRKKFFSNQEAFLEWNAWKYFLKNDLNNFTNSIIESLIKEDDFLNWEKYFEKIIQQKFLNNISQEELESLIEKGLKFKKEFSKIQKKWKKAFDSTGKFINKKVKIGEMRSLRPNFEGGSRANLYRWGDPKLFMKPMEKITEQDALSLQKSIQKMAERLKIRIEGLREWHHGKIDIRRTMKSSYKTFGEPIKLVKKYPKYKAINWLILSDVSGSVKHASRIFMSFIFELKNVMSEELRAFTFVSKVQEITSILQEQNYNTMVRRIYQEGRIDFRGYSDYGAAFQKFDILSKDLMDNRTILIIIGDARNNKKIDRLDLIHKWLGKVRKIIWLNPDLPEKWDQGDSVISIYESIVRNIHDVSTPEKLVHTIENILI